MLEWLFFQQFGAILAPRLTAWTVTAVPLPAFAFLPTPQPPTTGINKQAKTDGFCELFPCGLAVAAQ